MQWYKKKKKKQEKRIESSELDSCIYRPITCDDAAMHWTKNGLIIELIFEGKLGGSVG